MRKFFLLSFFAFYLSLSIYSQDNAKVETIIAFGTGSSKSDALFNAKINALDQIFGTFISTSTIVVNDSIAMNKMTSITNGQITNYEIIKTEETENGFIISIRVSANIQNLVKFCESIGIEAHTKGSIYSDNLMTKLNNRDNEVKVLNNFVNTFKQEIPTIFDYTISPNEPVKATNSDNFLIKINCSFALNKNFNSVLNVLIDLINQVGIKESELSEFKKSNLEFFPIFLESKEQFCYKYLRSKESQKIILSFIKMIDEYLQSHAIVRNDNKEIRPYSRIGDSFNFLYFLNNEYWEVYKFFVPTLQPLSIGKLAYKCDPGDEQYLTNVILKKYSFQYCPIGLTDSLLQSEKYLFENKTYIETPFFVISSKCVNYEEPKIKFTYNDWVTVDEMKKIERYSIKK